MFRLLTLRDNVAISPHHLRQPETSIRAFVNRRYSGKLLRGHGLCVAMYDLLHASECSVGHSDGDVFVTAVFRLIVFRPSPGTLVDGVVTKIESTQLIGTRLQSVSGRVVSTRGSLWLSYACRYLGFGETSFCMRNRCKSANCTLLVSIGLKIKERLMRKRAGRMGGTVTLGFWPRIVVHKAEWPDGAYLYV